MADLPVLPATRSLQEILAEDEAPSTFGSLFRFIGRPGFAVRNLLMGDFEGAARNVAQMFNELALGGFLNQNLTITSILGYDRDLTNVHQRPEFTNVLQKWGAVDTTTMPTAGKFALDLIGGIFTDPLTLVGGGAKSAVSAGKLSVGGAAAQGRLVQGLKAATAGPKLQGAFAGAVDDAVRAGVPRTVQHGAPVRGVFNRAAFMDPVEAGGRLYQPDLTRLWVNAPRAAGPGIAPSRVAQNTRAGAEQLLREAGDLDTFMARAIQAGPEGLAVGRKARLTPKRAAAYARGVEGRAAQKLFFDGAALEDAGVNLARQGRLMPTPPSPEGAQGFASGLHAPGDYHGFLNGTRRFALTPVEARAGAPPTLAEGLSAGVRNFEAIPVNLFGREFELIHRAADQPLARSVKALFDTARARNAATHGLEQVASPLRDAFRSMGYSDDWTRAFLQANNLPTSVMDDLAKWNKFLLETPSTVLDDGLKFLVKEGMAPSSGISMSLLKKEWAEGAAAALGWRSHGNHLYMPWSAVGSATVPGALLKANRAFGSGRLADITEAFASRLWHRSVRSLYSRFHPYVPGTGEKLPGGEAAAQEVRAADNKRRAAVQKHETEVLSRVTYNLPEPEVQDYMGRALHGANELYQNSLNALERETDAARAFFERSRNLSGDPSRAPAAIEARNLQRIVSGGAPTERPPLHYPSLADQRARGAPDVAPFTRNLIPGIEELRGVVDALPTNPRMTQDTLDLIMERGANSRDPRLRRAAQHASRLTEALARRREVSARVSEGLQRAQAEWTRVADDLNRLWEQDIVARGALGGTTAEVNALRHLREDVTGEFEELRRLLHEHDQFTQTHPEHLTLWPGVQYNEANPIHMAALGLHQAVDEGFERVIAADRALSEAMDRLQTQLAGTPLDQRMRGTLSQIRSPEGQPLTAASRAQDLVRGRMGIETHLESLRQAIREATAESNALGTGATRSAQAGRDLFAADMELFDVFSSARANLLARELTEKLIDDVTNFTVAHRTRAAGGLPDPLPRDPGVVRRQVAEAFALQSRRFEQIPAYLKFRAKRGGDLVEGVPVARAAWEFIRDNPFYLPQQLDSRLFESVFDQSLDLHKRKELMSVFEDRRNYPTISQFKTALQNMADKLGIDYGDVDELVDQRFDALVLKRLVAFENVKFRNEAYQHVRRVAGAQGGRWDSYQKWLDGVLNPVGPRKNTLLRLLGGGTFDMPWNGESTQRALEWWNKTTNNRNFLKKVTVGGELKLRLNWPGLNYVYKPLLTSFPLNLRYHFRNNFAMPFMAGMHPELAHGTGAITQARKALANHGIVRWATRHLNKWAGTKIPEWGDAASALKAMPPGQRKDLATTWVVRAMTASGREREAAWRILERLNDKVGRYTWPEVREGFERFIGQPVTQADWLTGEAVEQHLIQALGQPTHTPEGAGRFVQALKDMIKWGETLATEVEYRWRAWAFMELLEKGHTIDDAIEQVQKLFVDYSRNSEIERGIRDVIPFARFQLGSLGWAKSMAERPSVAGQGPVGKAANLQTMGMAQRSLMAGEEDQVQALPLQARESLALPLPWRDKEGNRQFLISLGLPQETTIQVLALLGLRQEVIQQRILGATQPVVKAAGEYAVGKSFYFGTEWGSYRKSPASLRPVAKKIERPDGSVAYEVPGWVNEAINATPLASTESAVNRLADTRVGALGRMGNALTGFRTMSVDVEAELEKRVADYLKDRVARGEVGSLDVYFSKLKPEETPEEVRVVLEALRAEREKRRRAKGAMRRDQ